MTRDKVLRSRKLDYKTLVYRYSSLCLDTMRLISLHLRDRTTSLIIVGVGQFEHVFSTLSSL